ncbi:MAG: hypothetical protein H0T73_16305, partial [Ardenticatenales bacterium]|nr:hypothetical protein [Ardenticatenales bacterium]
MTRDEWFAALPPHDAPLLPWVVEGMLLWDDVGVMGSALKDAAHAVLNFDLARSERLARALIALGEHTEREELVALGEMAWGDALRLQMRLDEGYELLDRAAARFERIGDELGWARTRIGWLGHIRNRPTYPTLEPIVQRAVEIFERHQCWGWLSTICYQYARYWQVRAHRDKQLDWCLRALQAAERIEGEEALFQPLARSLLMLLSVHYFLGHYDEAHKALLQLLELFHGERASGSLYVELLNQAGHFYLMTGRYTQALYYLYEAERRAEREEQQIYTSWWIAHVYRGLNRLEESMALLTSLLERLVGRPDWTLVECDARMLLSSVLAAQEQWQEALDVLEPAIQVHEGLPELSAYWLSEAYQQQARLLHRLGHHETLPLLLARALRLAEESQLDYALAEVHLLMAEMVTTPEARAQSLSSALAVCENIPWIRWRVHHLAATLADTPAQRQSRLEQAVADLDTVQSSLAASFHADYLDKTETLYHALIGSYLEQGQSALAWQTLERAKSRALINSMMLQHEPEVQPHSPLAAELEQLQMRHYTLVKARLQGHASW